MVSMQRCAGLLLLAAASSTNAQIPTDLADGRYRLFGTANNSPGPVVCIETATLNSWSLQGNGTCRKSTQSDVQSRCPSTPSPAPEPESFFTDGSTGTVCVRNRQAWFIAGSRRVRHCAGLWGSCWTQDFSIDSNGLLRVVVREEPIQIPASAPAPQCGLAATDWVRNAGVLTTQYNLQMQPVLHSGWRAVGRYNDATPRQLTETQYSVLYHGQGISRIGDAGSDCDDPISAGMPGTPADQLGVPAVTAIAIGAKPVPIRLLTTSASAPALSLAIESGTVSDNGSLGSPAREIVSDRFRYTWMYTPPASISSATPARLVITAAIPGHTRSVTFSIYARPVVAVHGLWGSDESFLEFERMFLGRYPAASFRRAHYGDIGERSFLDESITQRIADAVQDAQVDARGRGIAVGGVDLVAHSMGGPAAARYLQRLATAAPWSGPDGKVVSRFVIIGSPVDGSALATWLHTNRDRRFCVDVTGAATPPVAAFCSVFSMLSVADGLSLMSMPIGSAIADLRPGSAALAQVRPALADVKAVASTIQYSELHALFPLLSQLAGAGSRIDTLLGPHNDSVVALPSQTAAGTTVAQLSGLAHSPVLGIYRSRTQLNAPATAEAVAQALGRVAMGSAPTPQVPHDDVPTPMAELFAIDFAARVPVPVPPGAVTPASASAFSAINIDVANVPGCTLSRLFGYEALANAQVVAAPSRRLTLGAGKPGPRQILVVGLCENNVYFSTQHTIDQVLPETTRVRFDPPLIGPIPLGSSSTFRLVADTGSALYDVTGDSLLVLDAAVVRLEPGARIRAMRSGQARMVASYGALTAEAAVLVDDAAGVGLFSSGME